MADDQPIWGNNRAVAPILGAAIIAVDLGDNFADKGHHLSMIKDRQFDGRALADPHKHIANMAQPMLTCNSCGGPHPSSECDDKPMGGPKYEEANYAYGGYRGGGYRGNYYGRSFRNWRDRQPRDENRNSQPREEIPSNPPTPEKKFDESDFEKTMREFMVAQKSSNDFVKNQFFDLKTKVEQGQKNHQASIQDLEIKFGRLSDQCSSRPTGSLPCNTQTNPKPNSTNEKPYRPPFARNEHMNAVFIRSDLTYNYPVNPNAKTTVIKYFSSYEIGTMMAPGGSFMTSFEDIISFLPMHTPSK
ncbi:hypothetical protein Tco_0785058 [Tanacetum coccineum]